MKYRKKPIEVEAYRLVDGTVYPDWIRIALNTGRIIPDGKGGAKIATPGGEIHADEGDWIVQGVEGELYPCTTSIFDATYDVVSSWRGNDAPTY